MGGLSDKVKIVYLLFVIFFAIGVLLYLLDTWGVIEMEEYLPFVAEEAPVVPQEDDSPTALEWERLKKEEDRLEEERLKLEEERLRLQDALKELESAQEGITARETAYQDLVAVLLQMEDNAAQAGQQSIVPFLMTLLPRDRAALISTLMMDEEASRLPSPDPFALPPDAGGVGGADEEQDP